MAKFMAVYIGTATEAEKSAPPDPEVEQKGMAAWGEWMEANADAIVDQGGPLGRTKAIGPDGVSDARNELTGYVIVEAPSLDEAAARFKDHPHFAVFPGDRVEVVEILEMPAS
jgi:hypothetical protein